MVKTGSHNKLSNRNTYIVIDISNIAECSDIVSGKKKAELCVPYDGNRLKVYTSEQVNIKIYTPNEEIQEKVNVEIKQENFEKTFSFMPGYRSKRSRQS